MNVWKQLWNDEGAAVMSAEMVLLGTVGVVGATAGWNMLSSSVNDEMKETAYSLRSLDQSYRIPSRSGHGAWTAGSSYTQPPVEESLTRLRDMEKAEQKARDAQPADGESPTSGPQVVPAQPSDAAPPPAERKPDSKKKRKNRNDEDADQSTDA